MRKFKVGDLVTVVKNDVWYTHLNDGLRDTLIGRNGRVVGISEMTFTKEDLEWHNISKGWTDSKRLDSIPNDWTETVYDCWVVFPWMPESKITFTEAHLKMFEMPERN